MIRNAEAVSSGAIHLAEFTGGDLNVDRIGRVGLSVENFVVRTPIDLASNTKDCQRAK